ncbi:MAG: efflux RND transporter periplasmic adaptor subunit [Nitrospira sp.]|nr:efflux RND transporter periplasmic adaptor subunit [Nitrospira sp.]
MRNLFNLLRESSLCISRGFCGLLFGLATMNAGCDGTPSDVVASKSTADVVTPGLITLSAEESSRVGLVVQPAALSDFRTHRDFPAIVQPNQRNMAEITTLVRGRVVDVYGDLGQEVKANAPLAILYSSELGLAQSATSSSGETPRCGTSLWTGKILVGRKGHRRSGTAASSCGIVEYPG